MVSEYLNSEYNRTKFKFFSLNSILNKFGESGREELNELKQDEIIRKRKGVNGTLIELLCLFDGEIIEDAL